MMKKLPIIMFLLLFAVGFAYSQRTVSGTITDNSGEPLIGANVIAKGTTTGTITDIDGTFSMEVPESINTLVVSYTGYGTQELDITGQSNVSMTLSEGELLEEVVVTALGIVKEERTLGYSVDKLDSEELVKARSTNIVNSLQGKVTGVQINNTSGNLGGSSKILIRGATSLSGRNDPLWVIDGMPFNNDQFAGNSRISGNRDFGNGASVVNPDDVESISVLKGAAATALYGSRAAAGAIIVTTKKGAASEDGRARVEINTSYRLDDLFVIPDYQQDFIMGSQMKYDSSSVGYDWGPANNGQTVTLPVSGEQGAIQRVADNGVRDFFETGKSIINNFSISDGTDKSDYRLSLGTLNQTGVIPGSKLDRYSISLNSGSKHSDKFSSRFGINFIKTDSEGTAAAGANDPNIIGLGSFSGSLDPAVYQPWIDEAGNQINQIDPLTNNPYWIRNENKNDRDDTRILANFSLTYTPLERLAFTGKVGYDYGQDNRFLSNRKGTAQRVDGTFDVQNINNKQLNTDIIGTYDLGLTGDFGVNVLAGYNYNRRTLSEEVLGAQGLLVPELFNPGNTELNVPERDFRDQILMGLYTSVDLSYKDWATLTITGRNDWSSTLPIENNSYFYPSVSLAAVLTDAFDIKSNALNYAKLRLSYAQVGNDTGPYQLNFNFDPEVQANGQYGLNIAFPFQDVLGFNKVNTIPPANLRPEQQTSYEVGAELDFFDYRLGLDVAVFQTENKDQILALPIPQTTGFGFLRTNVGQVNTSGIEVSLDAVPLNFKNFRWTTGINYSSSKVEVVELAEGVDRVLLSSAFNSVQVVAEQGKGFEILAIPFLRDSTTNRPLINPATGTRLAGEAKTLGSVLPDFTMGFNNSFDIGNLNLSFLMDWRSGGVMKSSTVENLQQSGLVQETLFGRGGTFIDLEGVIDNGDGTVRDNDVPVADAEAFWAALDDGSIGEPWIFDASFLKLREVAVNYTFPKTTFGNSFIRGLTIGLEARNVALLWSTVPHIDPESNLFGSGRDGFGVERANIPQTRSVGFNVKAQF